MNQLVSNCFLYCNIHETINENVGKFETKQKLNEFKWLTINIRPLPFDLLSAFLCFPKERKRIMALSFCVNMNHSYFKAIKLLHNNLSSTFLHTIFEIMCFCFGFVCLLFSFCQIRTRLYYMQNEEIRNVCTLCFVHSLISVYLFISLYFAVFFSIHCILLVHLRLESIMKYSVANNSIRFKFNINLH